MGIEYWLYRATHLIRFTPDREAVRQELREHLQDCKDAFRARGLSEREAEVAATAAKGDPDELAWELRAVHPPLWGWLWRATQIVLVCLAATVVVRSISDQIWKDFEALCPRPELPAAVITTEGENYHRTGTLLQSWEPTGRATRRGYTFSVPLAYLQEVETTIEGETTHSYIMTIYLRVFSRRFWEPIYRSQDLFLQNTITDSDGTRYRYDDDTAQHFFADTYGSALRLTLWLPDGEAPDWLDIPVGWGGESIRLYLPGEVVR